MDISTSSNYYEHCKKCCEFILRIKNIFKMIHKASKEKENENCFTS